MQVLPGDNGTCTFTWIHDVLPNALAEPIATVMREAEPILKAALEAAPSTANGHC